MLGAGFSSLILASIHRNDFLFVIGIFTIYMVSTGWRYLYLKDIANGQKPLLIDWIIVGFMILGALVFAYMAIRLALEKELFCLILRIEVLVLSSPTLKRTEVKSRLKIIG
jgi:hypothetical protein